MNNPLNKRKSFRINYPENLRPKLFINNKSYEIIDISEGGVQFFYNEPRNMIKEGDKIHGKIVFKNKKSMNLEGKVMRVMEYDRIHFGRNITIKPKENISYEDIITKEQMPILRIYSRVYKP